MSNPMVKEYRMLKSTSATELQKKVNLFIQDGWQPLGPPTIIYNEQAAQLQRAVNNSGLIIFQTMIKYAPTKIL